MNTSAETHADAETALNDAVAALTADAPHLPDWGAWCLREKQVLYLAVIGEVIAHLRQHFGLQLLCHRQRAA